MSTEHFVEGAGPIPEVGHKTKFPVQLGETAVSAAEEQDYEEVIVKSVN